MPDYPAIVSIARYGQRMALYQSTHHYKDFGPLVLQRRVVLQGNSWADFEAGNERVRVSHDERSVAEEEDLSVFSHNASL